MPETELPTCAIRKYLLNVLLIFVNLATMCTRSLSTLNKHACFLKTPASLQSSDLYFNIIFSEKCNSSTVHLRERGRLCMYDSSFCHVSELTVKLWLTFTFMHLADAFIQSDLHCIQVTVSTFLSGLAFPGNRTHDLGIASAMLY